MKNKITERVDKPYIKFIIGYYCGVPNFAEIQFFELKRPQN